MYKNESFEYDYFVETLNGRMLNPDLRVGPMKDLTTNENVFIRPVDNGKLFSGQVVNIDTFRKLKCKFSESEDKIMMSSIKKINKEFRIFVVDGEIISGSSYIINEKYNINENITKDIIEFIKETHNVFPISKAYVIDIAETDKGYKVIEYNNINTSGLYGCDEFEIVKALQSLK